MLKKNSVLEKTSCIAENLFAIVFDATCNDKNTMRNVAINYGIVVKSFDIVDDASGKVVNAIDKNINANGIARLFDSVV